MFDKRIPFSTAMQQIEMRKWNSTKESFNQYAIHKLVLMNRINIPEEDKINLLIGGVYQNPIRASALSLGPMLLSQFLKRMRPITEGITQLEKRLLPVNRRRWRNAVEIAGRRDTIIEHARTP